MKKILLFIALMVIFQNLSLASSSLTLEELKSREVTLLNIWQQQKPFISQLLFLLKAQKDCSSFTDLLMPDLVDFVHRNLLLKNLHYALKKHQEEVIKLCQDIIKVRQDIKILSLS